MTSTKDETPTQTLSQNLKKLKSQINNYCQKIGRNLDDIKLIAVSKTKSSDLIKLAYQLGQKDFAENYTQELAQKINELKKFDICWHYIGKIQSNKSEFLAQNVSWIHSLDRSKIIDKLNHFATNRKNKLNVCLQINLLNETQKAGANINQIDQLAELLSQKENLNWRGLMFVPPIDLNDSDLYSAFCEIKNIKQKLQKKYPHLQLDTLSFGMSNDWQIALKAGSTCLRIGSIIFGKRV